MQAARELPLHDEDAVFDGVRHKARSVVQVELLHDVVAVSVNRSDADLQALSNLMMKMTFGDKLQDFPFPGGKRTSGLLSRPGTIRWPRYIAINDYF